MAASFQALARGTDNTLRAHARSTNSTARALARGTGSTVRCGTLADVGTPYGLGFVPGEHVHIQDRDGYSIVHNGSQLRWVTPYQVSAYVTSPPGPLPYSKSGEGEKCCAEAAREYLELRRALLASPAGVLESLIPVHERPLPAKVPPGYHGCPVVMADTSPVTRIAGWMGEHLFSPSTFTGRGPGGGVCTIYLETEYLEALLDRHRYDLLWATFRHERFESGCELALARAEFPAAAPRQLGGLAIAMNGLAHKMTVRILGEAEGEREYNDMLDRQREELGLGPV